MSSLCMDAMMAVCCARSDSAMLAASVPASRYDGDGARLYGGTGEIDVPT